MASLWYWMDKYFHKQSEKLIFLTISLGPSVSNCTVALSNCLHSLIVKWKSGYILHSPIFWWYKKKCLRLSSFYHEAHSAAHSFGSSGQSAVINIILVIMLWQTAAQGKTAHWKANNHQGSQGLADVPGELHQFLLRVWPHVLSPHHLVIPLASFWHMYLGIQVKCKL